jgi:hypothetical protein
MDLNWGNTTIYHPDPWAALLLDQTINYSLVIIHNALYFFGNFIINGMIEAPLTQLLNYYQYPIQFVSPFAGQ